MERRHFLTTLAALGVPSVVPVALAAASPGVGRGSDEAGEPREVSMRLVDERALPLEFPRNDLARVRSVVGASHSNFDLVRELVLEQPTLAKSSWDWGFGDWESALGAASHTGRRPIAEFLIAHGARPTLFSAAMLGQVDIVRAYLTADPTLYHLDGPHGINLYRHATAGGDDAQTVVDYLMDSFGADERPFGVPGDEDTASRYGGRYRFATDPETVITVGSGGMGGTYLLVGAGEQPNSRVLLVEPDVFHPTGAPAVRLRFEVVGGRAERLLIEDGPTRMTGARIRD